VSGVDLQEGRVDVRMCLSRDVRRAVHGVAHWPFDGEIIPAGDAPG